MVRAVNTGEIRWPAEWEPHQGVWTAWPFDAELWGAQLAGAQAEVAGMCRAIADPGPDGRPRGEPVWVLVPDAEVEAGAAEALAGCGVAFFRIPYGDIWLRDTGPIFREVSGKLEAACFGFNGWGGKYRLPHDAEVAGRVAASNQGVSAYAADWILEGGAIDGDGAGTILTTRQCLLNPNRNPRLDASGVENNLRRDFGADRILWLTEGLAADHTDGHVDNIARFIGPGRVLCMEAKGADDPNREVLGRIRGELEAFRDRDGNRMEIVTVPSAGRVLDAEGALMAASHVNFTIGNRTVVVPLYPGSDAEALLPVLETAFPGRRVVGLPAWHLLHGGGSFHCITQQVPAVPALPGDAD